MEQINRQDDLLVIAHCPEYVGSSIFSPKSEFHNLACHEI
jgi:hypothetical protein